MPKGDALVERCEAADSESAAAVGLADQDAGERHDGVHLAVGEQREFFELFGAEQVRFVADQQDAFLAFFAFA